MDQNTDSWMDSTGRLSIIVRTNSAIWGRSIRIRIDSEPAEPDMRVYVNRGRGSAMGSINFFHPTPAIPPSLTPTGTSIVYVLREQLSRSPPPIPPPFAIDDLEYRCYFLLLQQRFYEAMQNLKRADAELERGREHPAHGRPVIVSGTERRSIALSIVRALRLLQTPTRRPSQNCLLCNRPPASPREPEACPEDSVATNTLEVRSLKYFRAGRFSQSSDLDKVSILPPIREGDGTPMLCELHRYVFQYLMYQVVSPSWPVPYLQEDMARFGEIGVARWNPDAHIWQFQEPRR